MPDQDEVWGISNAIPWNLILLVYQLPERKEVERKNNYLTMKAEKTFSHLIFFLFISSDLMLYIHGKQLSSCRDHQLSKSHCPGQAS